MAAAAPLRWAIALTGALGAVLAFAACDGAGDSKACGPGAKLSRASGYCVPRYLSLKRGEVFARKGPGKDYETLWVYRAQGLPVQVVAETTDWRRICDPDGGVAWVHRTMLDGRRTVMARAAIAVAMRREAKAAAPANGLLNARALASLQHCRAGWCRISAGGVTGWVAETEVWGATPAAQCK